MVGTYQTSCIRIQKGEILDNLVLSIRNVRGTQFHHGGLNDVSQKPFKMVYAKCSNRRGSLMNEALRIYDEELQNEHLPGRAGQERADQNQWEIYAMAHDC